MIGFFFTGGIDQSLIDRGLRQIIANPEITAGNPAGKIGAWFSDLLINRWFGLSSFIFAISLYWPAYALPEKPSVIFRKNHPQYIRYHLDIFVFRLCF